MSATANYADGKTGPVTITGSGSGSSQMTAGTPYEVQSPSVAVTSLTMTHSFVAGSNIACAITVRGVNSEVFTFTDSSSQSWTEAATGNAQTTNIASAVFLRANTAALTSITASWGTAGVAWLTCEPFTGGATSAWEDSSAKQASATSLNSGALTTTNANDYLFAAAGGGVVASSWSPSSGYSIPNNNVTGNSGQSSGSTQYTAIAYQSVTATQSAVTMSFSTVPSPNYGSTVITVGLKGAAASGGTGWTSSDNTICSVNSNGLISTPGVTGTCTITAMLGSHSATSTITVNAGGGSTLTSITVAPTSASSTVGGATISFTATGNDSNDYTKSATWTSSNTSIFSMSGNVGTCAAAGSVTVTASYSGINGSTTANGVTCSVVSTGDLLAGCTVGSNNVPSCSIPAGWTLAVAEGFDGSGLANSNEELHAASVECTKAHTGSCALGGYYVADGNSYRWILNSGALSGKQEFYASWWEYEDAGWRLNVELYLARWGSVASFSGGQNFLMDYYGQGSCNGTGPGSNYNCLNGEYTWVANSDATGGLNQAWYGPWQDLNQGSWRQYEIHYKANTPGSSDGDAELYVNGVKEWSVSGTLNDSLAMTAATLWIGGNYSALAWVDNASSPTVCYAAGTGQARSCSPFSNCSPCPIPPNFNRYWDDIIVLKK